MTGTETLKDSLGKTPDQKTSAAESGAISTESALADSDLAAIVAAWPTLPEATRRAIIKLIEEAATD